MYFDLNSEQKMLAQTVRRFVEKECTSPKIRQIMQTPDAFDADLWNKMAAQGWMSLTVPEEFGGLNESWLTVAAVFEELGRGIVPGPFLATVALAAPALALAGNANQKARLLPLIAEGQAKATVAYLEPVNSYSFDSIKTTATPSANGYQLNGTKMFALDAQVADFIIVAAMDGSDLALFLIDKEAEGLKIELLEGMDLTRRLTRITLENTPAAKMDGAKDAGEALEQTLSRGCLALSAENMGGIQWILDTSVAYAKNREQYGRLIGSYQAVAHPLVDRTLELTSTRSALYLAAYDLDHNPTGVAEAVSLVKALSSDSYRQSAYTGIQTLGGIGFTWEHDMQLYFRRASANWSLLWRPNLASGLLLKAVEV